MKKPTYNLYGIINQNKVDELNDCINNCGQEILETRLKVGKCNLPLVEAIQKDKKDIFEIILKNLTIDSIFNITLTDVQVIDENDYELVNHIYISEIIKIFKKTKSRFFYDKLIEKIENDASNISKYYGVLLCNLIRDFSNSEIEKLFIELLNNPSFNYKTAFEDINFRDEFYSINNFKRFMAKPKYFSLINIFKQYGLNINNILILFIFKFLDGNWNSMVDTLIKNKKERQEIVKFLKKNSNYNDINFDEQCIELRYETSNNGVTFRQILLYGGFFELLKHYRNNKFLGDDIIESIKNEELEWLKKNSIFSPFSCIYLNIKVDDDPNYKKYDKFEKCLIVLDFLGEFIDVIYTKEQPQLKVFLLEILNEFKTKYPSTLYLQETIEKVNEIFPC